MRDVRRVKGGEGKREVREVRGGVVVRKRN